MPLKTINNLAVTFMLTNIPAMSKSLRSEALCPGETWAFNVHVWVNDRRSTAVRGEDKGLGGAYPDSAAG